MNKYPYFPFYPNDFISDDNVDSMSTLALGAYMRLLCKAWHQEPVATLPNDQERLAKWAKLNPEEWETVGREVLTAWQIGKDGRLHQKRLKQEYQKLRVFSKAKSEAGKRGALKKWGNGSAMAQPKQCHRPANDVPMAKDGISSSPSYSSSSSSSSVAKATGGRSPARPSKPKTKVAKDPSPHVVVRTFFCARWAEKYGDKYDFQGGKDGEHIAWMLKAVENNTDRLLQIVIDYFESEDPFYVKDRHSIGMLKSQFRKFKVPEPPTGTGAGIKDLESYGEPTQEILDIALRED